jgi:hypothetical protein
MIYESFLSTNGMRITRRALDEGDHRLWDNNDLRPETGHNPDT